MREHRTAYADLSPEAKQRAKCRSYSAMLTRRGYLIPQPCEVCGDTKVERHHTDYSKPMLVRWLCAPHHRAAERGRLTLSADPPQFFSEMAFFWQPRDPQSIPSSLLHESNAHCWSWNIGTLIKSDPAMSNLDYHIT